MTALDIFDDYALQIVLSTNPIGDEDKYIKHVEEKIYGCHRNQYKSQTGEEYIETDYLFFPIKFAVLGHYDLAYLNLFDNYRQIQKVFDNTQSPFGGSKQINYQVQAGAAFKNTKDSIVENFKELYVDKNGENFPFMLITNIKLNNGLLIGNGMDFLQEVVLKIQNELEGVKYFLLKTYNWAELTLVLFSKDSEILGSKIQVIRELKLEDVCSNFEKIETNSLYSFLEPSYKNISSSHCIVDTHSYFGIRYELMQKKNSSLLLKTNIEWIVKPGHFKSFQEELNTGTLKDVFKNALDFKTGKTDFISEETYKNKLSSNQEIFHALRLDGSFLKDHVRKLKTTPVFKSTEHPKNNQENIKKICNPFPIQDHLKKYQILELKKIDDFLKKVNISRALRMQVAKLFHNYNQAILDPLNYILHIDFYPYLKYFYSLIELDIIEFNRKYGINELKRKSVAELSLNYSKYVQVFEDAYFDRILNNVAFEDMNDINLDMNSMVTGLLSNIDTVVKFLSESLGHDKAFLLSRVNDEDTSSMYHSVNYNIHQVTDMAIVFATIAKEVLNSSLQYYDLNSNDYKNPKNAAIKLFVDSIYELNLFAEFKESTHEYFVELLIRDLINLYFIFNMNFDLYKFWYYCITFQNSKQYLIGGKLDINKMKVELLRLMMVEKFVSNVTSHSTNIIQYKFYFKSTYDIYYNSFSQLITNLEQSGFYRCISEIIAVILNSKSFVDRNLPQNNFFESKCNFYLPGNYNEKLSIYRGKLSFLNNYLTSSIIHYRGVYLDQAIRNFKSEFDCITHLGIKLSVLIYYTLDKFKCLYNSDPVLLVKNVEGLVDLAKSDKTKAFIDSHGEFYVPTKAMLKERIKLNHEIQFLLWDISIKMKKEYFKV